MPPGDNTRSGSHKLPRLLTGVAILGSVRRQRLNSRGTILIRPATNQVLSAWNARPQKRIEIEGAHGDCSKPADMPLAGSP
jgi:hypothetical protein